LEEEEEEEEVVVEVVAGYLEVEFGGDVGGALVLLLFEGVEFRLELRFHLV